MLKPGLKDGFVYSDCRVDDARLVVLNAINARTRGAAVLTRTRCAHAQRTDAGWQVTLAPEGGRPERVSAAALVNAAGPWADRVRAETACLPAGPGLRLVKGSHIVVPSCIRTSTPSSCRMMTAAWSSLFPMAAPGAGNSA